MSFNIGDRIGDYQIIGVLGAGGMGKVYKVQNVISERVDAMKVLLPDLATEPELADRFLREIKVLASLNHPNIAALYTALRIDNQLLMVMELLEGTTLEESVQRGPLPLAESIDFICQVLSALSYAHARGVIHRDIKPANMMLTPEGTIKLMDFGIAKSAGDRRLTMTGTTLGSLYYMSPEQIQGKALDGRADLYSVGVSLYELVTGVRPFRAKSDYELMVAHLQATPLPPIQLDPNLPPMLNEIILTALAKDPTHRFQSAEALRNALEAVRSSLEQPISAGAPAASQMVGEGMGAGGTMPQIAPPMPVPAGGQGPPPPPQVARARSHRGLYMALGALLAIAVLVFAATQLPRWLKTKAGGTQTSTTQETTPPPTTPQQPSEPTASELQADSEAGQEGSLSQPATPSQEQPGKLSLESFRAPATPPTERAAVPRKKAATAPGPSTPAPEEAAGDIQTSAASSEAAEPAAGDSAKAAYQDTRERMISLAARANAVRASLQNLQRQQTSAGLSLRSDITASWNRMESFMDEADAAWKVRDLESVKRNLDLAEREADKLERFLGR